MDGAGGRWPREKRFVLRSPTAAGPGRHGQGVPLPAGPAQPPPARGQRRTVPAVLPAASAGRVRGSPARPPPARGSRHSPAAAAAARASPSSSRARSQRGAAIPGGLRDGGGAAPGGAAFVGGESPARPRRRPVMWPPGPGGAGVRPPTRPSARPLPGHPRRRLRHPPGIPRPQPGSGALGPPSSLVILGRPRPGWPPPPSPALLPDWSQGPLPAWFWDTRPTPPILIVGPWTPHPTWIMPRFQPDPLPLAPKGAGACPGTPHTHTHAHPPRHPFQPGSAQRGIPPPCCSSSSSSHCRGGGGHEGLGPPHCLQPGAAGEVTGTTRHARTSPFSPPRAQREPEEARP